MVADILAQLAKPRFFSQNQNIQYVTREDKSYKNTSVL